MNQLAGLAEAVARLRETERQAAWAAAARRAEEQLLGLVIRISTAPEAAARAKVAVAGVGVAPARVVPPWLAPTRTPTSSIGRPAASR
jgi:hypothetical protein